MTSKRIMAALFLCAFGGGTAIAADHQDGPQATNDPAGDITDVYTWMPDATHVALVMDVTPDAGATAQFSDAVQYVFHTSSAAKYGATTNPVDVICQFDATQKISCWVGANEYVTGDASATTGLSSADGKVKVFAGKRNDPFFFNLDGFKATVALVEAAAGGLSFTSGCPTIDAGTSAALVAQLAGSPPSTPGGTPGAPVDHFKGFNVLSIVLSVDKSLLTAGGAIIAVNGATYTKP